MPNSDAQHENPSHFEMWATKNPPIWRAFLDGASRTRTGDLLGAIQALSQLSYSPERRQMPRGCGTVSAPAELCAAAPRGDVGAVGTWRVSPMGCGSLRLRMRSPRIPTGEQTDVIVVGTRGRGRAETQRERGGGGCARGSALGGVAVACCPSCGAVRRTQLTLVNRRERKQISPAGVTVEPPGTVLL